MRRSLTLLAVALVTATVASAADPLPISSCGDTVPPRMRGVLTNDITCPGTDVFVVKVEDRGKLDLAGFTLAGAGNGVLCPGRCNVTSSNGSGTIRDTSVGLHIQGKAGKAFDVTFTNADVAILAGFSDATLRGTNVSVTGATLGAVAKVARFTGLTWASTTPGTGIGVQALKTTLRDSQITGGASGVQGSVARLTNTTVTGNTIDLETAVRPRLTASTCNVSKVLTSATDNWGVCTND